MTKLKIKEVKPLGYHVVIELAEIHKHDEKGNVFSQGGIALHAPGANFEQDSISVGKVLSIGEWAHKNLTCGADGHKDWGYDVGDMVSFQKHMGKKVSDDPSDMRRLLVDHEVMMKVQIGGDDE